MRTTISTKVSRVQAAGLGRDEPAALLVAAAQHHADQDTKCETILASIRQSRQPGSLIGASPQGAAAKPGGASGAAAAPGTLKSRAGSLTGAAPRAAAGKAQHNPQPDLAAGDDEPLAEAVRDCVAAAGWMASIEGQRRLLKAALYGRCHAPALVDAALLPTAALHCRVVNSLRQRDGVRPVPGSAALLAPCQGPVLGCSAAHATTLAISCRSRRQAHFFCKLRPLSNALAAA